MPTAYIDEESSRNNLLRQSFEQELTFRMAKNYSYSTHRQAAHHSKTKTKNADLSLSDWNNQSQSEQKRQSSLPCISKRNLEELSRQLNKYDPGIFEQQNEVSRFRLTFLRKLSQANFQKTRINSKSMHKKAPKKVDLKLQFPPKYEYIRLKSQQKSHYEKMYAQIIDKSARDEKPQTERQSYEQSFNQENDSHIHKRSKALIPSIKKLANPVIKKTGKQSEENSYSFKKSRTHFLNETKPKNFIEYIEQKQAIKQREQRQRKVKAARVQRKLPLNFLNYSKKVVKGNEGEGFEMVSVDDINQIVKGNSFYINPRRQIPKVNEAFTKKPAYNTNRYSQDLSSIRKQPLYEKRGSQKAVPGQNVKINESIFKLRSKKAEMLFGRESNATQISNLDSES